MKKIIIFIIIVILVVGSVGTYMYIKNKENKPDDILNEYISKINEQKYEEMYYYLDDTSKQKISKEDFVTRNKNIYEGIDMSNMEISINEIEKLNSKTSKISFTTKINASGGQITFDNSITLNKDSKNEYKISWGSNLIFPELNDTDKVRVNSVTAKRGSIIDRNGKELATNGKASSVGIVPGKLGENREQDIEKMAELLNVTADSINTKLSASWVKDDSFVPIKTVSQNETELKENLLKIAGVKITTVDARVYPLGEAAAQLTGYVQTITKEELEKNEGYSSTSLIGKAGLEKQYESRLKGTDGVEIYIVDGEGNRKTTILNQKQVDGEDIKLTIDSNLQNNLYAN